MKRKPATLPRTIPITVPGAMLLLMEPYVLGITIVPPESKDWRLMRISVCRLRSRSNLEGNAGAYVFEMAGVKGERRTKPSIMLCADGRELRGFGMGAIATMSLSLSLSRADISF